MGIRLLKIASSVISESLSRIINHCITTGKFPTKWKVASVTPIYKGKGCKSEISNFRPISVLPVLSKVFERHIATSLRSHLKENNLLYGLQSGFRKSFSTETALIRLLDQLLFDLDENRVSALVFVDYRKAFDLIDHSILIKKLYSYGIRGQFLELFESYFSDRSQRVNVGGVKSAIRHIDYGVPQGSILGPLLFTVFTNDLPGQIERSVVDMYADDTTLSHAHDYSNAPQSIVVELQKDITSLTNWSRFNHLVMNEEKTKTMLVTGRRLQKKLDTFDIHLSMNGKNLEQVSSFKLLGLTLDDELSFDVHVEKLCTKLSQRIAVLSKIKRCLPHRERIIYYNAMIKPVILYGSTVWTVTSKENLNRVLKLQKRAARVILDMDTSARSVDMLKQLD